MDIFPDFLEFNSLLHEVKSHNITKGETILQKSGVYLPRIPKKPKCGSKDLLLSLHSLVGLVIKIRLTVYSNTTCNKEPKIPILLQPV